ncbi:MAG TPA: alkaline phosphatase family protein [Solirubrobacteraceae bacterium]|nr:alkaline phosphatase family protein [Solirubrobacteraceae bacterium]
MDCGARRGALAPATARWIGIERPAEDVTASEASAAPADQAGSEQVRRQPATPSPSIVGVAVMALLAFGVFIGSAVRPAQDSGANGPLVVADAQTPQAPSAPAPAEAVTPPPPATPEETPEETPLPTSSTSSEPSAASPAPKHKSTKPSNTHSPQPSGGLGTHALPPIKHVFLIVLSDQGFNQAFGPGAPATYLSKTLVSQGELLNDYYAVSGGELANEIALISGQGPTVQTAEGCPLYTGITPGTVGATGQVLGSGCVYPSQTDTLAEQLTTDGLTWKAYVEGIGEGPTQPTTCPHPALGAADANHVPTAAEPYVTWRDPFAYFESVTGNATCASSIVGLGQLAPGLKTAKDTPALSYIVPDRCHDGSEEPCAPGEPAGLAASDSFLSTVVPEIESSPAYKTGGLIAVTFDRAPQSGPNADTSGCCMTSAFPNLPASTPSAPSAPATTGEAATTTPAGGGRVGLLLISKYTKPGSINVTGEYNDFSLLASIEDLFEVSHLGYASSAGLLAFNKSVYNAHP